MCPTWCRDGAEIDPCWINEGKRCEISERRGSQRPKSKDQPAELKGDEDMIYSTNSALSKILKSVVDWRI